jgi:hypothetical protein
VINIKPGFHKLKTLDPVRLLRENKFINIERPTMAYDFGQIKKWGCLYALGCIGFSSFIAFIMSSMTNKQPANKWIFLGITVGCIIWIIKRYSSPVRTGGCSAQCPHCQSTYEICCGNCGGVNLDPVFEGEKPDMDHIVGLKCGTGPRLEGGCGFSMDAVTCPQCNEEVPVRELKVKLQRRSLRGCWGCLLAALVGLLLLLMTQSYLMHKR